jgi:hypothetical protein
MHWGLTLSVFACSFEHGEYAEKTSLPERNLPYPGTLSTEDDTLKFRECLIERQKSVLSEVHVLAAATCSATDLVSLPLSA